MAFGEGVEFDGPGVVGGGLFEEGAVGEPCDGEGVDEFMGGVGGELGVEVDGGGQPIGGFSGGAVVVAPAFDVVLFDALVGFDEDVAASGFIDCCIRRR